MFLFWKVLFPQETGVIQSENMIEENERLQAEVSRLVNENTQKNIDIEILNQEINDLKQANADLENLSQQLLQERGKNQAMELLINELEVQLGNIREDYHKLQQLNDDMKNELERLQN